MVPVKVKLMGAAVKHGGASLREGLCVLTKIPKMFPCSS